MNDHELIKAIIEELKRMGVVTENNKIPVGISNRHIHLTKQHVDILFGENYQLKKMKNLSQPGQYACEECVTLATAKGCIEKVRILGPTRKDTQVEILQGDAIKLGIDVPVRESGDLAGTPGISVIGTKGCLQLDYGVIIAQRHIHMTPNDAEIFGTQDDEIVSVKYEGIRGGVLDNVIIRVSEKYKLDFHIDIDEANCFQMMNKDYITIVK